MNWKFENDLMADGKKGIVVIIVVLVIAAIAVIGWALSGFAQTQPLSDAVKGLQWAVADKTLYQPPV